MDKETYSILFERYIKGDTNQEEENLLLQYRDKFDIQNFSDELPLADQDLIKQRIYAHIEKSLNFGNPKIFNSKTWWAVAASVVLIACASIMIWKHQGSSFQKGKLQIANTPQTILPGSNRATLTLSNGSVVDLSSSKDGIIVNTDQISITKTKDGQLTYRASQNLGKNNEVVQYNTITTPRGGRYQVVLPDGTNVWLNAASSLKYPTKFTNKERNVELIGEAYFDVAHDPNKPFSVKSNEQVIKVLGTQFNINAYQDESQLNTTLVKGSVKLTFKGQQLLLKPGQTGIASKSNNLQVENANLENVLAWRNGLFILNDEDLPTIMRKAARWYDIEVEFKGDIPKNRLWGTISMYKDIRELLDNITLSQGIHYKIEGRRVILMK